MNNSEIRPEIQRYNRQLANNIHVGDATLLACSRNGQSGWALPGEGFTASRLRAIDVAKEMNRAMGGGA